MLNRWITEESRNTHLKQPNLPVIFKDISIMLVLFVLIIPAIAGSFYTVPEGHVGIVKRFGAAIGQETPGLHFKLPFFDKIENLEVRTRKSIEVASAATKEQMPITVKVSINWTVTQSAAKDLFVKYGGLEQFENRILDPRLRQAAKAILSKFTAEKLLQNREQARSQMQEMFATLVEGLPIDADSAQIEDIKLPNKYLKSIETKQTEKNLVAAEGHKLERQKLEAQRDVQSAEAQRDAQKAKADGKAYAIQAEAVAEAEAIRLKGTAEAEAIREKAKALKNNPLIVQLTHEQQWNGQLPTTIMGSDSNVLWQMKN